MSRLSLSSALCAFAVAAAFAVPAVGETVITPLIGFQEVPANTTDANGSLRLFIDDRAGTITYELSYENLSSAVTQAHIHVGQAGVNGGISLWLCQAINRAPPAVAATTPECPQSGTVTGTLTAASVVGPAGQLVAPGELDEVIRAIRAGVAYGNVHTTTLTGGEIRGQLH